MSNPNMLGGTGIECGNQTKAIPDEEINRYLWETLYKLRKKLQFAERENAYLKSILGVVYEPEKLKLALAKYREWKETETLTNSQV